MTFPKYQAYKDSGVEWLGEVPEHWTYGLKLLNLALEEQHSFVNGPFGSDLLTEELTDEGVPVIYSGDVKLGGFVRKSDKYITPEKAKQLDFCRVDPGDLLLAKVGDPPGEAAIYPSDEVSGIVTQDVIRVRINQKKASANYVCYLLNSKAGRYIVKLISVEATRTRFSLGDFKSIRVCIPSIDEQAKIARFLDHETARIDALIAEQERLIELLKEKRQAVISHAVTKGLDPTIPMKDSGIEWLGDVPAHWETSKLKFLTRQIVDGAHFTPTYVDDGVPFLRVTDIQKESLNTDEFKFIPRDEHEELTKRCKPEKGDLLLSKNGTIGVPRVIDWDWEFSIFVSLCLIKFSQSLNARYAYYFFLSSQIGEQINSQIKQSTVINLHLDKIENFIFPLPPIEEQILIVDLLDKNLSDYDSQIKLAEEINGLLQERRSALISAAVTGKIDVRGWKAPESDTPPATLEAAYG